ncbi:hypothetical protein [Hymenobacter jeollabukensis]|uniref:Uncharacterized protein n=1 Tax=Hymenobacter jeollabukensis TaxID=2025313 RepID=A0A5R8WVB1_9BACT|nr:hypothetical protein [Hymenobacter jeollabukensis]TLM95366.1 hypothetical protein FDY95_06140 [Hymenobacter jeollabukensis]
MKNLLLLGFVAGALLSVSACSNPDFEKKDQMAAAELPELPAVAVGKDSAAVAAEQAAQEISAVNATTTIKKMQPVM